VTAYGRIEVWLHDYNNSGEEKEKRKKEKIKKGKKEHAS